MDCKTTMTVSFDNQLGYIIDFDEGLLEEYSCIINEKDIISVDYGNNAYSDYEENRQRRKETIKNMIFNEILGDKADELMVSDEFYFEGAFKTFEKYVIDNDVFVRGYGFIEISNQKDYRTLFHDKTEVITIIINDKRIKDIFGISINKDNSFELYTKRPKEELNKQQVSFLQDIVKEFVLKEFNLKINFGRDLNGPIKIKRLYESALKLINNHPAYSDSHELGISKYGK